MQAVLLLFPVSRVSRGQFCFCFQFPEFPGGSSVSVSNFQEFPGGSSVSTGVTEPLFRTALELYFWASGLGSLVFLFLVVFMAKSKSSHVAGSRGPKRAKGSIMKMKCAYAKCRCKSMDCKNKKYQLKAFEVEKKKCRPVREHAKTIRFCSQKHLDLCRKIVKKRGGREALTQKQVVLFYQTLVWSCHAPWAAVLMLLQLFLGDRCDCARQAATSWFVNFGQHDVWGWPEISIPKVNGKTQPRKIPLNPGFADLLWGWMTKEPLSSGKQIWPPSNQDFKQAFDQKTEQYLFCGRSGSGHNLPVLDQPISERAFLKQIRNAAEFLRRERQVAHQNQQGHVFDDIDLSRIGTHTWKKTAVTIMKEQHIATSLVSALTGTSPRILDEVYDVATKRRQRHTVDQVFGPIVTNVLGLSHPEEDKLDVLSPKCPNCFSPVEISWNFCSRCAANLTTKL